MSDSGDIRFLKGFSLSPPKLMRPWWFTIWFLHCVWMR